MAKWRDYWIQGAPAQYVCGDKEEGFAAGKRDDGKAIWLNLGYY